MGAHMDGCCEICGDQGVLEAIATCTRCKVSREHAYCMRIWRLKPPADWCCENCELRNTVPKSDVSSSNPLEKLQHNLAQPNKDMDLRLSNTLVPNSAVSSSNPLDKLQNNLVQPNKDMDLRRKSMEREKKIPTGKVKLLSSEEVIKLSSGSKILESAVKFSICTKPALKKRNISDLEKIPLKTRATQPNIFPRLIKANPSFRPLKQFNPSRLGPGNSQINTAQAPRQQFFKETSGNAASPNPVLQTDHPGTSTRSNLSSVNRCPYDTLPHHFWKGSFRVRDNRTFEEDKIQAHHPCEVNKMAYEFSKKMPGVLNFELIDRKDIWVKLFADYLPDQKNIGVYLLPSNGTRSGNYISMLEHIHAKDVGLRMVMDETELLVFTSKVLRLDCQRWEGDYFLWGLFYRAAACPPPLDLYENLQEDNDQVGDDMEIDMVGGLDVGKTDIVVPRTPMQLPDPSLTNGICSSFPPGFERMHNSRVGRTTPPADWIKQVKVELPDGIR